jgi:hypothetical protein
MTFEDWKVENRAGVFDPEGTGYDYEAAIKAGLGPDRTGHWPSRIPETGQILKGRKHPTYYKTTKGEKEAGYTITKGAGDRYYSDGFEAWKAESAPEPIEPIRRAGQAVKELVAAPVRTLESMTAGAIGGVMRMGAEKLQVGPRVATNVARLGQLTGKVPGDAVAIEHLIRKYGLNKPYAFYDRKVKKLADAGKKISDFWNEQANKGWEAPNPDIVEARWRDRPISKTVSAVSSGLTSIGVVVGTTLLTKSPRAGLMALATSETGGMYGRLRDKNVSVDVASKLALMAGAWTYVTEKIPFERLMKPGIRSFTSALKQSGWEGAQEVIEGMGHNLLEYFGYDYKEPQNIPTAVKSAVDHMMDNWMDSLVGGIGAGGLAHVALHPGARPKKETLSSAAIRLKSGEMLTGTTHANILREVQASGRQITNEEFDIPAGSGFLTNTDRFVSPEEAWEVADKANQIKKDEIAQELVDKKYLIAEGVEFDAPVIAKPPTVEEIVKKPIEEIEPQTSDHAIGHQYGIDNAGVDEKLAQAELRYRELKTKVVEERTQEEMDELAFLSRNRTNIEAILERETQPAASPKVKRTQKNLLALGHKIARDAGLTDIEYRDLAEVVTGKRSMGKMTKEERNEFVSALEESYGAPKELTPEDYDIPINVAGRPTSMREVYKTSLQATGELVDKKDVPETIKLGTGKTGQVTRLKNFFFGIDNTPVYHLAKILDSGKEGIFSEVLDKGIEHGRKITYAHARTVTEAMTNSLEESGITDDDLAKMSKSLNPRLQTYQMISKGSATEISTVSINGKNYEVTMANLIDIYLMSNQEDGIRHLTKGGLVINGIETGKLSEGQIDILRLKVEESPKARMIVDTILEVGEQIWKPSINQVSTRLEGIDIATVENWWGLEVHMPDKLAGKIRAGKLRKADVNLLEDKSILKDRTRSTAPLVVRDAFNRFNVFENAIAEYVGMAEPSRTSRTLLNDPDIAASLERKGYGQVRKNILKIHERAQGITASEGDFSAWFAKQLPGLYRAVIYFNPRLVASQYTSVFNYGANVSPEFLTSIKDGLSVENSQDTLALSDVAWNRFNMGRSSLELGEMVQSDAALRMWTGGKSADINKAAWAIKVADLGALTAGMEIAKKEYDAARTGNLTGLSAEWWLDKNDLPEANSELWKKVQAEGENADPEESQAVEAWKGLVTERAEYLWQRTQPSWDKWNRSVVTSEKGLRRLFLLFRSFHEKSLTIFNEAKLDYSGSPKNFDDKVEFAQKTGSVLTGYTVNMFLRLAIMATVTRELKEPAKYLEDFITSWMSMFPIFGKVLQTATNRFVDVLSSSRPSYTGEALDSYPIRVINMILKSPADFTEASAHAIMGDVDEAKEAFMRGTGRLAEGVGTLSGVPVPEIKRILPKEEPAGRAPTTRRPAVRR